jgi:hypothetical protein
MKIFNLKRMSAIQSTRLRKYLLYALGEIILVVIGIVIGLQINKLNDKNKKQIKIENYYSRISEEADIAIKLIENNNIYSDSLVNGIKYCLNSIANNKTDSLFIKNLIFLNDNEQQTFFFPVIDEFLEQGYLTSIKDISLREQFQLLEYYRKQSDLDDSKLKSFSENILLPKLVNKINFLDIDFMNYDSSLLNFEKLEYSNDYENDYSALSKDITIWNLLIYRMNIEKNRLINNKSLLNILKRMNSKITTHQKEN